MVVYYVLRTDEECGAMLSVFPSVHGLGENTCNHPALLSALSCAILDAAVDKGLAPHH